MSSMKKLMSILFLVILQLSYDLVLAASFASGDLSGKDYSSHGCKVCAPGYAALEVCNGTKNTVCVPCPPGTFNDKFTFEDLCRPCGGCEAGFYQWMPCTSTSNVRCTSCTTNGDGYGNEDYLRKCESVITKPNDTPPPTLPVKLQSTTVTAISPSTKKDADKEIKPPTTTIRTVTPPSKDKDHETPTTENTISIALNDSLNQTTPDSGGIIDVDKGDVGSGWPLILAGITAAMIFFVLGSVISLFCRGKEKKKEAQRKNGFVDYMEKDIDTKPELSPIVEARQPMLGNNDKTNA